MRIDKQKLECLLNNQRVELSKTEKLIHDYVINNPEQVIYDTIGSICKKLNIGEASFVRYFKKLNYQSFNHFKMELYRAIEELRIPSDENFVNSVTKNLTEVIKRTSEVVSLDSINQATKTILNSNNVFVTGMGISYTSAQDLFSRLLKIGVNASIVTDSHFAYMYTAILDKKSCIIIYSFSGETPEMIKIANHCKERNIKIIVVSNYTTSTLHEFADIFIQIRCLEPLFLYLYNKIQIDVSTIALCCVTHDKV